MPVKIDNTLKAFNELTPPPYSLDAEIKSDLKVGILNLMPKKIEYEKQLLTKMNKCPQIVEPLFITTSSYKPSNTPAEYLERYYISTEEVQEYKPDMMIISGAPVELMEFESVTYWKELCNFIDWAESNCSSVLYICWGAQAALYHRYRIEKHIMPAKLSGVYSHITGKNTNFTRNFPSEFNAPHSRYTTVNREDILKYKDLIIEGESDTAGVYLIVSDDMKRIYVTGHPEYMRNTLKEEYIRDIQKGLKPSVPLNYFPENNTAVTPDYKWKSHGDQFFRDWINYTFNSLRGNHG